MNWPTEQELISDIAAYEQQLKHAAEERDRWNREINRLQLYLHNKRVKLRLLKNREAREKTNG